jgi:hypothetical protein
VLRSSDAWIAAVAQARAARAGQRDAEIADAPSYRPTVQRQAAVARFVREHTRHQPRHTRDTAVARQERRHRQGQPCRPIDHRSSSTALRSGVLR